ncbi:hypothetical protein M011DRAFT_450800 [Sporormia fimetaria CBS 119925]|uniref:Uncharacterized protein n=1 Tax=Sporormia fimetaria CBS 119925 TaxID=1340428 RepID=A0A6A6V137_9PLEO|nr:hypothetical protein M011DRAFT_450800 [Sporormia fimetaria CBS 119925]
MGKRDSKEKLRTPELTPTPAYPARLQIYDAGTLRTWVVGFWKACAVFQFSITLIFVVPLIWKHQPDPTMRLFQPPTVTLLGTIPTLLLSYLTAPYVARISIHLPASARVSKSTLQSFISRPPSTTTLEIATLRVFPFARTSFVQLKDLRSLPYQPSQLANFVRVEQEVMQKAKMGVWKKMWEVLKEPRWKFYVPDGKKYVPRGTEGVWEGLARYVRGVSEREAKEAVEKVGVKVGVKKKVGLSEGEMKERVARERVRRQTARKAGR